MTTCIIGIDCATVTNKVGLARGFLSDGELIIDRLTKPASRQPICDVIADWIDPNIPTLLALDAPLGWPEGVLEILCQFFNVQHNADRRIDYDREIRF